MVLVMLKRIMVMDKTSEPNKDMRSWAAPSVLM